jgi:hypothetical protein
MNFSCANDAVIAAVVRPHVAFIETREPNWHAR